MTQERMKTELIIVRHAKSLWNAEHRLQGVMDIDLHPIGVQQAEALADRLSREAFQAIYSSDLKRAYHTAECIARKTQHQITTHAGLRERNFGILQGLTAEQIQEQYPHDWERFRRWDPDYTIPQGVSLREYYESGVACVEQIANRHPGERIVIVTHGGILNGLLRHTLSIPLSLPTRFTQVNTAINVFAFRENIWYLDIWGDVNHLRHLERQA